MLFVWATHVPARDFENTAGWLMFGIDRERDPYTPQKT
jgi:hypothetical protein